MGPSNSKMCIYIYICVFPYNIEDDYILFMYPLGWYWDDTTVLGSYYLIGIILLCWDDTA